MVAGGKSARLLSEQVACFVVDLLLAMVLFDSRSL